MCWSDQECEETSAPDHKDEEDEDDQDEGADEDDKGSRLIPKRMFLAPQSGALRISAYRDFQFNPIQSNPIHL